MSSNRHEWRKAKGQQKAATEYARGYARGPDDDKPKSIGVETMETILLLLAMLVATPAWAGGVDCGGVVDWATADHTAITITREGGHVDCMVKDKALVRRFLNACPIGSKCFIWLGDGHKNY